MGISLKEQGYELYHDIVLIWDELDKNEAIIQMEEEAKRKMGGL